MIKYALCLTMKHKKKLTLLPKYSEKFDQSLSLFRSNILIIGHIFIAPRRKIIIKTQRPPPDPSIIKSSGFIVPIIPIKIKIKDVICITLSFSKSDLPSAANKLHYGFVLYNFSIAHEQYLTVSHHDYQI